MLYSGWKLSKQCGDSFNKKTSVVFGFCLAHYDPLKLAGDTLCYGIGALLSHCYLDGTIAFTSIK